MRLTGIFLCFSFVLASCVSLKNQPQRDPSSAYYIDPQFGDYRSGQMCEGIKHLKEL